MPDSANSRKRILRDSKNRAESADSSGFRANSRKRILRILKPCRILANSRKRILRIPKPCRIPANSRKRILRISRLLVHYVSCWKPCLPLLREEDISVFAKYLDGATRRRGAQATRGRLSSPMKKTSWNGPPEEDDSGSASRHVKTRSEEDEAKWSLEEDDSGTILQVAFRRRGVTKGLEARSGA